MAERFSAVDEYHRNFRSVAGFELRIAADVDDLNFQWKALLCGVDNGLRFVAKVTAATGVNLNANGFSHGPSSTAERISLRSEYRARSVPATGLKIQSGARREGDAETEGSRLKRAGEPHREARRFQRRGRHFRRWDVPQRSSRRRDSRFHRVRCGSHTRP